MMKKTKITVVGVASAATFAAGAATAYAVAHDRFGYSPIRNGIPRAAAHFSLTSPDLVDGGVFPAADVCAGPETTPRLAWSGAPAGTKSFAVEMFDPDAPSGSGFSHWRAWDIPATASTFGGQAALPAGTVAGLNDFGDPDYDGPCPPAGDVTHHYKIRVLALDTPSIGLPSAGVSTAYSGYVLGKHAIGVAEMTVSARR
jgi:Raf kinase inhibitor-like YbhB/YbcL family protein